MQVPNNGHTNLVPAGTVVTATTTDVAFKNVGFNSFVAYLNVTAHSGTTPTLNVQFQDSADGTNWINVTSGAFTQVTTTNGMSRLAVTGPIANKLQAVVTTGGTTPSYTMSLDVVGCNN